jgi:lipopolysaccharide/colanic/teichoic acid biosynthesis glycosyltransferase
MRQAILILGGVCVFAVAAAVIVAIMPSPLKDTDYLVIGSIATLVSLLVMFLVLIATRLKSPDPFFKKRRKKR